MTQIRAATRVLLIVAVVLTAASLAASCGSSPDAQGEHGASSQPPPTLPANVAADARAIEANETAQAEYARGQRLASAATETAVAIQGTATRVALSAQQTVLAQQVVQTEAAGRAQQAAAQVTAAANATREAIAVSATRQQLADQATRQAQSVGGTATAQSIEATRAAAIATATRAAQEQIARATQTTEAMDVLATQASGSATSTANAANAQATRVSAGATATVIAAATQTQVERENWTRATEWAWSLFRIVAMIAVAAVLVLAAVRAIQIWMLRRRAFRDANGELVLVLPGGDGQDHVTRPGRMPGPVLQLTPPHAQPYQVEAPAADPDTTKRDQAISLVRAAAAGDGRRHAGDDLAGAMIDDPRVQIVDEPPAQLVSGDVVPLLEAKWKEVNDDAE